MERCEIDGTRIDPHTQLCEQGHDCRMWDDEDEHDINRDEPLYDEY